MPAVIMPMVMAHVRIVSSPLLYADCAYAAGSDSFEGEIW